MNDLKNMQDQAVDLDATKRANEAAALVRQQAAQAAAEERVLKWERKMQRAFKGIMARPVRRRFLHAAMERDDDA